MTPHEKARVRVRTELTLWLMDAHAILNRLIVQPERWRDELVKPGSVLAEFITPGEASLIECELEAAISAVASVIVPAAGLKLPDPMATALAARKHAPAVH